MSYIEALASYQEAIANIQYFSAEWLPLGTDERLANIRLMELDELLFEAKFALSHLMHARPTEMWHVPSVPPAGGTTLADLGLDF